MATDFTLCHILDLNHHRNVISESKYMCWGRKEFAFNNISTLNNMFSDFSTITYELIFLVTHVLASSQLAKS